MKKFTTFLFACMLMLTISATARTPQVILNSKTNYEISIDSRTYSQGVGTTNINDLYPGVHTINVYTIVSRGIFGMGKKTILISTQQFTLRNNDINIVVDQAGQIRITDDNYNDRRYGNSEGKGKGHKYGHYKNKKEKKDKHSHKDDNHTHHKIND